MRKNSYLVYTVLGNIFEVWACSIEEARTFAYNILNDVEDDIEEIEDLSQEAA